MPVPADRSIIHEIALEFDAELESELVDLLVLNEARCYFPDQLQPVVGCQVDRDFRTPYILLQEERTVDPFKCHPCAVSCGFNVIQLALIFY
jgi:hypothetical protein